MIEDGVKCCYISKEVGYITATGCSYLFDECVRLSKECNELTLPKISDGYNDVTILNVKLKDSGCLDVIKYTPESMDCWFGKKHYWNHNWTLLSDNSTRFYGSGSDYAEGAYRAGVSPEEAIIAASKCDHYTNGDVQAYELVSLTDE